jgi:hypothetical protein
MATNKSTTLSGQQLANLNQRVQQQQQSQTVGLRTALNGRSNGQVFQPTPENAGQNWDYQTATTDMQGNPLPEGAKGFDPLGRPYFGPGLPGTLKRYAWQLMGSPSSSTEAVSWKNLVNAGREFLNTPSVGGFAEVSGRGIAGLFGYNPETTKEQDKLHLAEVQSQKQELQKQLNNPDLQQRNNIKSQINELNRRAVELEGNLATRATSKDIGGYNVSLLMPAIRASQVGMTAIMDVLQEGAIKTEQTLGAMNAVREVGAQSDMPEITTRNNLADGALRGLLPYLDAAYGAVRFFDAPLTAQQKADAVKKGWQEGRLLYTEAIEPAVQAEYRRRAAAGEDPQLLAMELQNPWAEMVGQVVLDPLNVVGTVAKAAKVAGKIDEASRVIKTSGLVEDASFLNKINDLKNVSTDAEAISKVDDLVKTVQDYFYATSKTGEMVAKDLKPQEYKLLSLSAEGNQMQSARDLGQVITWGIGNIYREGRNIDDVNDWLSALVKLSSKNMDEVRSGISALMHFASPKTNFGESFLRTSQMIRNILEDEKGVMNYKKIENLIEKAGGDWEALGNVLKDTIDQATKAQYPTISEMKKAADAAEQARLTGKAVPERTKQLSQAFTDLKKSNPGAIKIAELNEVASKPKNFVNGILGKFYFSYQYGVAARNILQNNIITLITSGPKAWFRDGKFWSDGMITEEIKRWHGGELPPAAAGFKTLRQELQASGKKFLGIFPSGSALMEKGEVSAAKRVYFKFFRDTMDRMIKPGVALPAVEDFKAIGMTDAQIGHFTQLVKNNYGDVKAAFNEFDSLYKTGGPDLWKMVDSFVSEDQLGALKDAGLYDEIIDFTRRQNVTRKDINTFFDGLRNEMKNRAASITEDLPGYNPSRPMAVEMENLASRAGKYFSNADGAKLNVLLEASYQAHDKYIQALTEIAQKTGDQDVIRVLGDLAKRTPDNQIRQITTGITEKAWEVTEKSKKGGDLTAMWAEIGAPGPVPSTPKLFRQGVWEYVKGERIPLEWSNYFDRTFQVSEEVAKKFGTTDLLREARMKAAELQEYRTAKYTDDLKIFRQTRLTQAEIGTSGHATNIRTIANEYSVASASTEGASTGNKLLNIINNNLPEGAEKFAKLEDVPLDVAEQALAKHAGQEVKGISTGAQLGEQIPAPYVDGAMPVPARAFAENSKGFIETLNHIENQMISNWGMKAADEYSTVMSDAMKGFVRDSSNRIAEGQLIAQKVGEYWRDFALLPYGKTTHLDHALSYIYPYQFWYSRSYANWAKMLVSDPQVIAAYAKMKDAMAAVNKEAPEWWKYNVELPKFMWGLNNNNPMFINLEASVWPLYGLTGTDFNDPYKRTNWFTSTVDDLGKFGPSVWAPVQWAMAAGLTLMGEKDAAARWGGRAIPQTATIKSLMSVAGLTPKEFDPAVQIFSGNGLFDTSALDPYERGRVGRALSAMIQDGVISETQAIDAARSQQGPIWDEAVLRATQLRAPGQIASFFAGVGFKARTPEDVQIDNFYADYGRLMNLNNAGLISPDDYRKSWDVLRNRYPFMDTVLLAKRAGDDRDRAYAYNVLSRIPPGQTTEVYKLTGINKDLANKFYDSGGKFDGWKETDKQTFLSSIVDAAALLAIPSYTTKSDWTNARLLYKAMQTQVTQSFGEDIYDKIDTYYQIPNRDQAKLFLDANPEVSAAMDMQTGIITNTPNLMKYYGGIDTLDRYYNGKVFDQLDKEFGADMPKKEQEYFNLKLSEAAGNVPKGTYKKFAKDNNLYAYWDRKDELKQEALHKIVELGSKLPDTPQAQFRSDAVNAPAQAPQINWQAALGPDLLELIQMSYQNGEPLPDVAQSELDYQASRLGYDNTNTMLRDILIQTR